MCLRLLLLFPLNLTLQFDALPTFGARPPLFHLSTYILTPLFPSNVFDRHRDEKPVTTSPLVSALTNCDARNPFRIRSYENCRIVLVSLAKNLSLCSKSAFPSHALCSLFSLFAPRAFHNTFTFSRIRTLSKNSRVYRLSFHSGTSHSLFATISISAILNAEMAALTPSLRRFYSKSERIRLS